MCNKKGKEDCYREKFSTLGRDRNSGGDRSKGRGLDKALAVCTSRDHVVRGVVCHQPGGQTRKMVISRFNHFPRERASASVDPTPTKMRKGTRGGAARTAESSPR